MDGKTIRVEFEVGHADEELLALFSLMESVGKSTAGDNEIQALSKGIKTKWWAKHKKELLGEDCP